MVTRLRIALAALLVLGASSSIAMADVHVVVNRLHVAQGGVITVTAWGDAGVRTRRAFPIVVARAEVSEPRADCRMTGICVSAAGWPIQSPYTLIAKLFFPYRGRQTVKMIAPLGGGPYRLFVMWWHPRSVDTPGSVTLLPIGLSGHAGGPATGVWGVIHVK